MKNNLIINVAIVSLLVIVAMFFFSIKEVLTPFVFSFVIAYMINPAVKLLQKWGCSKIISVMIMMIVFITIVALIALLVVPLAYYQSINLIHHVPKYIEYMNDFYNHYMPEISKYVDQEDMQQLSLNISTKILDHSTFLIGSIWNSGLVILSTLFFIVLTPIILFHASYQWENILKAMQDLIPLKYHEVIIQEVKNIDEMISGYIRGQTLVCILAATYYMTVFSALKLQHAVFIGLLSGLLTFIPYVGSSFCFIASHIVAFGQFDSMWDVCKITTAFAIEQVIEIAFLIPYLIGDRIKLHPLWVIFAILSGGALLGFIGVLIALPAASIIGALIRFTLSKYLSSNLYAGRTIALDK